MFKVITLLGVLLCSVQLSSATDKDKDKDRDSKDHHRHHHNPNWTFTVDKTKGSVPLQVTFDASKIHEAKKFYWDFGNGETFVTKNKIVSYQYKTPGTFVASLKFSVDHNDHIDEKKLKELKNGGSKTISVINLPPITNLSCSANYLLVNCNGLGSLDPENQPLQYTFLYGDGFTETNTTGLTSHAFSLAGLYTVELKVTDSFGATSSSKVSVQALKPPNIVPTLALNCSSEKINVLKCDAIGSVDSDGTIASFTYAWDDGASNSKEDSSALEHTFLSAGDHTVTLSAVDNEGGVSSLSKKISVRANKNPVASFTCDNSKAQKLSCHSTSTDPDKDDSIQSYNWSFGNILITTATPDAEYSFNSGGMVEVALTVLDGYGGSSTTTQTIEVLEELKAPPRAFFKYFLKGTEAELHATLTKTQFDFARAYYTIDGAKEVALEEFYPNTIQTIDLLSYGKHTITLTVIDKRGQVGEFTHQVNVLEDINTALPYVGFNYSQANARTIFFNFNPSFNPDPIFGIKNYRISFGDGTFADINNDTFATHVYQNAGEYDVSLTVLTAQGTRSTITKKVVVSDEDLGMLAPVASFGYRIYDWAQNVTFNNETSGTPNGEIISYVWSFGDGTTGTGANTNHFYNPGDYLVTLTVVDSAGMQSSQTQHVKILAPGSDLVANIDCAITLTSGPFVSCKTIVVDKYNQTNFARVYWGDGTSSGLSGGTTTHKYLASGNYTITLLAGNSRGESAMSSTSFQVILPDPIAKISCSKEGLILTCDTGESYDPSGFPLVAHNFSAGDSFETGFTSQNYFQHEYTNPGTYTVTASVKSSTGQSATATYLASMTAMVPLADIQCQTNYMLVNCNALGSYDVDGRPLKYLFDYSDGFTEENYTGISMHAYTSPGLYSVKVFVTDTFENTSSTQTTVMPVLPPNQLPTGSVNCTGEASPLTLTCLANSSADSDGTIVSYKYIFDDGYTESIAPEGIVSHQLSAGDHKVLLLVTDNEGGQSTFEGTFNVRANQNPVADFACDSSSPQRINCWSQSNDPDRGDWIINTKWEVTYNGQLEYSSEGLQNWSVNEVLSHSGDVQVRLQVFDQFGGRGEVTKTISLKENQAPVANINCFKISTLNYQCNANAYDPDGTIVSSNWSIEGKSFGGPSVIYQFDKYGEKVIALTLTDDLGKVITYNHNLSIFNTAPVADFNCDVLDGGSIDCKSTSADEDGYVTSVAWSIDNSTIQYGNNLHYSFQNIGIHKVSLTVTDDAGFSTTITKNYDLSLLTPSFDISFKAQNLDIPKIVKFSVANLIDRGNGEVTYLWDLGDGTSSTDAEFFHSYDKEDVYTVVLTITNSLGVKKTSSILVPVKYESNVQIAADVISGVAPLKVHFDGSSSSDNRGNIVKYEWMYMGKTISTSPAFDWIFDNVGEHVVSLVITNSAGNITTQSKKISTTMPSIYLDGLLPKNIFAEREYRASFKLETVDSIQKDNVQIILDSAPEGVSFDSNTMQLSWIPDNFQTGYYEFKIYATDGIISSYRIARINVIAPQTIASGSVPSSGGSYTVNNSNSILDGTLLTLPRASSGYSFKVITGGGSDSTSVVFESSIDLEAPIKINYREPREIVVNGVVSNGNSSGATDGIREVSYTSIKDQKCIDQVFDIKNYYKSSPGEQIEKVQIWYDDLELEYSKKISKLIKLPSPIRNTPDELNIYFNGSYIHDEETTALVYFPQSNIIIFNNNFFFSNPDPVLATFTLSHEYYHILQNRYVGCKKDIVDYISKFEETRLNVAESTADYYGVSALTESKEFSQGDIEKIVTRIYTNYQTNVSEMFSDIFTDGAFALNQEKVKNRQYKNRLFFERTAVKSGDSTTSSVQYDYDEFFKYWIDNWKNYRIPFNEKNYKDERKFADENMRHLFIDFGRSKGVDPKSLLIGIGRDLLDNKQFRLPDEDEHFVNKFSGTYFLKSLKSYTNFSSWMKYTLKSDKEIKHNEKSLVGNFTVVVPRFSTDVRQMAYGKYGLLSYALPFKIKYKQDLDLAVEIYTKDHLGTDLAFYNSYITSSGGNSYKNIIVNPNPFDVGPMASVDGLDRPVLLWDYPLTKPEERYDGNVEIYFANSSMNNVLSVPVTITTLCKTFDRDVSKPLVLACNDKITGKELKCWDDLGMVVYFCPENASDVTQDCLHSKAENFPGPSKQIFVKYNIKGTYPKVFGCQQKKSNDTEILDFDFSNSDIYW